LVTVLGYRDKHGIISLPSAPFAAGQRVYSAKQELIRSVLGLDIPENIGAYIGLLRSHDMKVHLNINELVQKHVSVIAKTGSGKSYIVGILVEELLKRKIPVIVLDPHGEYSGLMHPNIDKSDSKQMSRFNIKPQGYSDAVHEYSLNPDINSGTLPLTLPSYGLSPDAISELLGLRGTGVQTAIMFKAINRIMNKKNYFTLKELRHVIELDKNSAKWHLINNLENLIATGIFADRPTRLRELVQPGRVSVINLRGIPPTQQQIAVTHLTRQLFEARKLNKIPAMMLVVEESHQFCPQQGSSRAANILKTIASEGRKFGLGMTLVTQRPAMVDKNVLSQCNTQIILKVTNPNDLKALVASVEGLNASMVDEIQRLPISVAVLIGAGIQMPVFVDVRVRETKHGGRPVDIFTNVETFYANPPHNELEQTEQPEYGVYGYAVGQVNDKEKDKGGEPIKAEARPEKVMVEESMVEESDIDIDRDTVSISELIQGFNKKKNNSNDFLKMMEQKFSSHQGSYQHEDNDNDNREKKDISFGNSEIDEDE
jgi:DNA helicase HerA-like ATPase